MANPNSRAVADAGDWPGQQSSMGSQATQAGSASLQVNLTCTVPGELTVRPGLKEVVFQEDEA